MIEIIGSPKLESKKAITETLQNCYGKLGIDSNRICEIIFVDRQEIQKLNLSHRNINKPTDVLSFPQTAVKKTKVQILGSIVICENIASELGENDIDLVKHGFLHLLGFDHETNIEEWDNVESKIK